MKTPVNKSTQKILSAVLTADYRELVAWMDANPRHELNDAENELYKLVDAARAYLYETAKIFLARESVRS